MRNFSPVKLATILGAITILSVKTTDSLKKKENRHNVVVSESCDGLEGSARNCRDNLAFHRIRLRKMSPDEVFWKQLHEYLEKYGATMVIVTISSGLIIGYLLHYCMNVRPLKLKLNMEKMEELADEDEMKLNNNDTFKGEATEREPKQVGVVKGTINSNVLASLRRKPPPEIRETKPPEPVPAPVQKPIFEDRLQDSTSSDVEDNDNLVVVHDSGKKRSQSLQENCSLSDRDLLHTLGKLHGKLATAQLRARTRKMQADMTAEERDDVEKLIVGLTFRLNRLHQRPKSGSQFIICGRNLQTSPPTLLVFDVAPSLVSQKAPR
ncbi:hypothetical protein Y032_0001g403 [Ancylostoma ceylanicum]|nr:hypothetical protein Y032_0001g403 [Ancylostoma ceylanicum]